MKYEWIESINWEKEFPDVPDCVCDAIDSAGRQIMEKKNLEAPERYVPKKRMLLLAAVITLLSGMTVMAAASFWQQRMEAMNREEMEEYFLSIVESKAPAFRYNRMMTEDEQTLFKELNERYENEGIFPENALTMLDSAEEYKGMGVGYDSGSGTFFLPDRELNPEELLQMIDFHHKAAYAVSTISTEEVLREQSGNGSAMEDKGTIVKDNIGEEAKIGTQLDYQPLNGRVSYYEIQMQFEEMLIAVAAGEQYLYLGFETEIRRMALGTDCIEDFYELKENESVFAMDSDDADNIYVSLREYDEEHHSYTNRLIKINADGEVTVEYSLKSAGGASDKLPENFLAGNMLADEHGRLYVKGVDDSYVSVFLFDMEGNHIGNITSEEYITYRANEMCFGRDGFLYLLAGEELLKIDTNTREIVEAYDYGTDEMIAAVDMLHSMGDNSFYILSYDGLFLYTMGAGGSERILAPYETDILTEAYRYAPISENELVVVNMTDYENLKYKITYLTISE